MRIDYMINKILNDLTMAEIFADSNEIIKKKK